MAKKRARGKASKGPLMSKQVLVAGALFVIVGGIIGAVLVNKKGSSEDNKQRDEYVEKQERNTYLRTVKYLREGLEVDRFSAKEFFESQGSLVQHKKYSRRTLKFLNALSTEEWVNPHQVAGRIPSDSALRAAMSEFKSSQSKVQSFVAQQRDKEAYVEWTSAMKKLGAFLESMETKFG
ncbi:MAG: hypothetical protein P1V97_07965 [Planctomycetota bacterium]|nr:hypothetical protein [Planctomycetota bacterium]